MKNLFKQSLSIIAILLASVFAVNAQTTATATLNLKLNAMQSITVNSNTVDLEYTTLTDYVQGVSTLKTDHLKVFSTGQFVVSVEAADLTVGGLTIPSNTIKVLASNGSNVDLSTPIYNQRTLTATAQSIITSATSGNNELYNVTYTGAGNGRYIDEEMDTYTTIVTYTISTQ